jgi:hypothetical protein
MAAKITPKQVPIPTPTKGGCGYVIERGAQAGEVMAANECAFVTYALVENAAIGLPQPTVAFWGPGQKIVAAFGQATARYTFVGGIVFRNC